MTADPVPAKDHDPVDRLNTHHQSQLLAIARVFGERPEAIDATATNIDARGIDLNIVSPTGVEEVRVDFAHALPDLAAGTSLRMAFRQLAKRA